MRQDSGVVASTPPHPPALVLVAPAEREVSFGRIAGRVPRGRWAVVVRAAGRTIAVREAIGASFDFTVSLPRRDATVRVTVAAAHGLRASAVVPHVFGLPRSARPRPVSAQFDGRLGAAMHALAGSFPGTSAFYVRDLVSGHGAAWNARARFPAASTLKAAIAVAALRAQARKPEAGSYLDTLLRRMLIESDNSAANAVESTFGGGRRVDELLRGLSLVDTWMGGGYLREPAGRAPIPARVESQPSFGCCKYTTAFDLARLLAYVHLAAGGRGPLAARYGREFTAADARYLLYLLAHVPDRRKLGRFLAGGPYALLHKAGWISAARHDAGLVYWPGGVFVAAVMTWGSGVGVASDVLAGKVASVTLRRLERLG
jgi:beta-lactamase family protein